MFARIRNRAALLAGGLCLAVCGASAAAAPPAGFRPFAPDSIWNLRLLPTAPLRPNSRTYVDWLAQSVAAHGAWLNTTNCGMPEYWASANTPTVPVRLNHPSYEDPALMQAWSAVPLPRGAAPAGCSDRNFAVLQRQPSGAIKEWEFWEASKSATGAWTAEWGGTIGNVLTDRGVASPLQWTDPTAPAPTARHATYGWNVTASGMSMLGGVITNQNLESGTIDHALAMAVTSAAAREWMWPAQRTDGYSTDPAALPEGAHLRLSPTVNVNALPVTPLVKMLARAAQQYGIVVRDQTASSDVFYAEPPDPGQPNLVYKLLDGQSLMSALAAFPWAKLQVLNAPICTSYAGCQATQKAVVTVSGRARVGSKVTLSTSDSVLNYPRVSVTWVLGSGRNAASVSRNSTNVSARYTQQGWHRVRVDIVCADGSSVTGTTSIYVRPAVRTARLRGLSKRR
ncbi:MAG TPA: hypothetical protein VG371_12565 [Solirubrobacteraceae bacterium]|nr:hypothetical protein [Solirubrobacteraceae bacterium]